MTAAPKKVRVAVLISGRGSNMVALAEAAREPSFPAEIVLVLANDPGAEGLSRAGALGIPTRSIDHRAYPDRATFDAAIDAALHEAGAELVCLAGFMRILTDGFVEKWAGRMLNIHPSLLPLFKGTHTHAQALAAGVRLHGCTVHFVVPELDAGPIVAQAAVPVHEGDDPDSLAGRVIVQERKLYPAALALVAGGKARLAAGRVVIDDTPPQGVLFSL